MKFKSATITLVFAAFAIGMASGPVHADDIDLASYKAVAKTICTDFTGEKILQDADVMGKFLEKKLNASADAAMSTGKDIITDLKGGNFYCFDQQIMVQYLTSKIPGN